MYSVPLPGNMSTRNVAEGTVFTQSAFGDGCLVNNIALEITPLCSSDSMTEMTRLRRKELFNSAAHLTEILFS